MTVYELDQKKLDKLKQEILLEEYANHTEWKELKGSDLEAASKRYSNQDVYDFFGDIDIDNEIVLKNMIGV